MGRRRDEASHLRGGGKPRHVVVGHVLIDYVIRVIVAAPPAPPQAVIVVAEVHRGRALRRRRRGGGCGAIVFPGGSSPRRPHLRFFVVSHVVLGHDALHGRYVGHCFSCWVWKLEMGEMNGIFTLGCQLHPPRERWWLRVVASFWSPHHQRLWNRWRPNTSRVTADTGLLR